MKDITKKLSKLEVTPPAEIRDQWERLFRRPVPSHSPHLLRRQIAWKLQAKMASDLSAAVIRQLDRLSSAAEEPVTTRASDVLTIGSRLIREWNGRKIEVIVVDKGYEYAGRHFRSLSQIARHITGARWSGPRFFGISAKQQQSNG
ncbi:MAG: DUF2924 domain-containing protein [Pseudomonadota bacterium]